MSGEPLPGGWRITLDRDARRIDGGRVLVGGAPFRLLRLTAEGARLLDRWSAGEPLGYRPAERRLARRLVDRSLAHPSPDGLGAPAVLDVSLVIPVRDDAPHLAATIAVLGGVREVVVVDDGSLDAAAVVAAAGSATVVRHEHPRGPAAARNTGWRATDGEITLFVDADVALDGGALQLLLAHLADPSVVAVAPRVRSAAGRAPGWLAAYESSRSSLDLGTRAAPVRPGSPVPYVPTAALLMRRDALAASGGFDEDLPYGEDVDLVWRLVAAGGRIRYEPAAAAHHPSRADLRSWLRQRYRYGTSAAALAARHGDALAPLGTSGWSGLAWTAAAVGHPGVGMAVAAGSTAALAPKLSALEHPGREALLIAGRGHLFAGRAFADALRRPWWPLAALGAWRWPRLRPAVLAAAALPPAVEWCRERPALDPLRYALLRALDDGAYGAGVWVGCLRERSPRALLPRFSGRIGRPAGPAPTPDET